MKHSNSYYKKDSNNQNTINLGGKINIEIIKSDVGFRFQDFLRFLYGNHQCCEKLKAFQIVFLLLVLACINLLPNLALAQDPTISKNLLVTGEDVEKVRPDIGLVVYASVLQMRRSQTNTYPVVFNHKAQQVLQKDTFQYLGFGKPLYSVTHFVQKSEEDNIYNLGVIMYFTDANFRRCTVFNEYDYSIEGEQIIVKQVGMKQFVPDIPQTLFAIVPADRVMDDLLQKHPSNVDLLNWIVVNSLKFGEIPENSSKQPYYIFAATLDRIGKDAKLQIRLSNDKNGLEGELGNCIDIDYEGWHVAIVRAEIKLKANKEFFIKTIYTPDENVETKLGKPMLIGVYSSNLQQVLSIGEENFAGNTSDSKTNNQEISIIPSVDKSNNLPVINLEIKTVSGGAFEAPVWVKFYPDNTYDPDGDIVLFEMDMNGDGIYDVTESTLTGGSHEFTKPGEYNSTVRVTDDKGGVSMASKSFTIGGSNIISPTIVVKQEIFNENKPFENSPTISESWLINQHNGFKGTLNIQIQESRQFSGNISWDRHESGTVNGQINDNKIEFTVYYSKTKNGSYKGDLTQNNTKIINGTVKSNDGSRSTWDATKVITNEKQFNSNNASNNKPLTTYRMYHPDSIIKSGIGKATNIREDQYFDNFKTSYMEPDITWTNGMFTHPDYKPTEMIYYHDQSDIKLSGFVSILNCLDYCESIGDCGFSIAGDGNVLWESGIVRHHDKPVEFNVSLNGINELRLIVNNGGDNRDGDWGVWMSLVIGDRTNQTKFKEHKNMLINGSFEDEMNISGQYKIIQNDDELLGWEIQKGNIDVVVIEDCADGKYGIDLNGTDYGAIQQSFSTKKREQYKLSFYLAGNPWGKTKIKRMTVSVGDQSKTYAFNVEGKSSHNMGWQYHELIFTAKNKRETLKFESINKFSESEKGAGVMIDDIKVVPIDNSGEVTNENRPPFFGFDIGLFGGASYYLINDEDISRLTNYNPTLYDLQAEDHNLGYHIGIATQMRFWRILLRPEFILNYSLTNYQVQDLTNSSNNTTAQEGLVYFDVPVLLGYQYKNFRFMGGLVGHMFITHQSELNDIGNFSKDFEKYSFGYQTGIGFDKSHFGIDLRYEGNFRQIADGVLYKGNKIYFAETPHRVVLSLIYNMN